MPEAAPVTRTNSPPKRSAWAPGAADGTAEPSAPSEPTDPFAPPDSKPPDSTLPDSTLSANSQIQEASWSGLVRGTQCFAGSVRRTNRGAQVSSSS